MTSYRWEQDECGVPEALRVFHYIHQDHLHCCILHQMSKQMNYIPHDSVHYTKYQVFTV